MSATVVDFHGKAPAAEQSAIRTDESAVVRSGVAIVFGFLGAFFLWALLFPISSAVIAGGQLVSNGHNKLVQHVRGGIVRSITAADGQYLEKGDIILSLDDSEAKARLTELEARYNRLAALKARLTAEKTGGAFGDRQALLAMAGDELRGAGQGDAGGVLADALENEQRSELQFGRSRREAELRTARSRLDGVRARASGAKSRMNNQAVAVRLTRQQIGRVRPLVQEGYVAKSKLWDLEARLLEQRSTLEDYESEAEVLRQQIIEGEAEVQRLIAGNSERVSRDLTVNLGEMAEIGDQIAAARNAVNLSVVRAPSAGTVTNLQANTVGGVIPAGATIAAIVPRDGGLIAEASVTPQDIDSVRVGQKARVALTAFSRRLLDPVPATVFYVAADSVPDPLTGEGRFKVRVRFEQDAIPADLAARLTPGMTVDVYIESEPRVFLAYVLRPFLDAIGRAFREPG